ncbi:MAG: zinc ribbon domain-containing protein [Candidatus Binatia bacterium]
MVDPDDDQPATGRVRAALEREKALVLRTIKEIEFDHAMGKTAAADFEDMRDRLKVRAVGLMRQLESSDYRAAVEHDLAARRGGAAAGDQAVPPRVATAAPASAPVAPTLAPPRITESRLARLCGACQGVNDVDARFCKHCGASLVETA